MKKALTVTSLDESSNLSDSTKKTALSLDKSGFCVLKEKLEPKCRSHKNLWQGLYNKENTKEDLSH